MAIATTRKTYEPHETDYVVIRDQHARIETRFSRVRLATLACAGLSDDVLRRIIETDGLTEDKIDGVLSRRGQ